MFAKNVLSHASFNLRNFITSSQVLRDKIKQELSHLPKEIHHVSSDAPSVDSALSADSLNKSEEHKVLGVHWNVQSDKLVFELSTIVECAITPVPTKRRAIGLIGRFYDPLRFLSPIIIKFKVLMQWFCKTQVHWEASLEGDALKTWRDLTTALLKSTPVAIDRYYFST